ncbi:MAG: hypothetical protein RIQ88_213 [Actinomycetota bacterium]
MRLLVDKFTSKNDPKIYGFFGVYRLDLRLFGGKLVKLLCVGPTRKSQMHPILENSTACTMSMPRTWLEKACLFMFRNLLVRQIVRQSDLVRSN